MPRGLIKDGTDNGTINKGSYCRMINEKVKQFFLKKHRVIDKEELAELYDIRDYILVGTKKVGWEYTNMFIGKFEEEKYYNNKNNYEYSNGDIVYINKEDGKLKDLSTVEIRHHFTTHSIQGETIDSRIFIDISKMFDSRMFYTAISRARKLDQIYLVC